MSTEPASVLGLVLYLSRVVYCLCYRRDRARSCAALARLWDCGGRVRERSMSKCCENKRSFTTFRFEEGKSFR